MSKSGLFGHFGSKDALQRAVLESVVEDFRSRVILPALREPGGAGRMRRLFTLWLEWASAEQRDGACPLLGASIELDDRPGELRDYLVEKQKAWLDCIARIAAKRSRNRSSARTSTSSNSRSSSTTSASASISLTACWTTPARANARRTHSTTLAASAAR